MKRPDDITSFVRCGGMHCDNGCADDGRVERCFTWQVHTYIEELEKQLPRWISVEERLPEWREDVAIIIRDGDSNYLRIGWVRKTGEWMQAGLGNIEGKVTHWMPLPDAPKEE